MGVHVRIMSVRTTTTQPSTTSAADKPKTSVLILNTAYRESAPMVINGQGRATTNFNFVYEDNTYSSSSCSFTFQNEFYIMGGAKHDQNQIAKLGGCSMKLIGQLDFAFFRGACTTVVDQVIYLFFSGGESVEDHICRVGRQPLGSFEKIEESSESHWYISIAASAGIIGIILL